MGQLMATRLTDYGERPASCRLLCLHALRKASKVVQIGFVKHGCVGTLPRLRERLYLLQGIVDSMLVLCVSVFALAGFLIVCPNMCHTPV
jgi:hypothetical protein